MTITRRIVAAVAAVALGVGALWGLAGCAPAATDNGGPPPQQQPQQQQPPDDEGVPDGPVDPAQETKIDGVAVSADGPSPGNLFVTLNDDGSWCKGATLFWNPTVAEGVAFWIENISGAGLDVRQGDCGDLPQCLGQSLPSNEQLECSILLSPQDDFEELTPLEMTGTITCPDAQVCADVRGRVADTQDRLVMCSPAWVQDGNSCAAPEGG